MPLTLDSNDISREHTELSTEEGNLVLRDLLQSFRFGGPGELDANDD